MAYTVSLPFDRRLARRRHRRARGPTCAAWCAAGHARRRRGARRCSAALDTVEAELADGAFVFVADRRGHPHRGRAPGHRAGRRCRRQAPHRPEPQRPGRHRPAPLVPSARWPTVATRRARPCQQVLLERAAEAGDAYLPGYTHLQRAQPVLLAHHLLAHGWALAARRRSAARRPRAASTCRRSAPARWPARRCRSTPARRPTDLGFAAVFDNSLDAVSDRDFVAEALFDLALHRRPPVADRRGDRALVQSTSSASCRLDDAYSTGSVDAAAEEEPRHRRAGPGQGRPAHRQPHRPARHAQGPAAGVQPRSPGGQGAAVRLGRPGRRWRWRRCGGLLATLDASTTERDGRRGRRSRPRRPPTWPSTWCGPGRRSARRTPSWASWSGGRSTAKGALVDLVAADPRLGDEAAALVRPGVPVRQRTSPGGAGPQPVAEQLQRFEAALERAHSTGTA